MSFLSRKARRTGLVLRRGAQLEVRITLPGAIGQVVRYRAGKRRFPKPVTLCLPPGGTKPAAC